MMSESDHPRLDPTTHPPAILHRDAEQTVLRTATRELSQHLYVHGPHGTGKTLLVRDAVSHSATPGHYFSCIPHDTQYKVLAALAERLTDDTIQSGYHTAQLQQHLVHHLRQTDAVVVLDDLAFLLANDGNDLLYFLSRLEHRTELCIIGISASQAPLTESLDERTYSSLRPRQLPIQPYSEDHAVHILQQRVETGLSPDTVDRAALEYIAATTTNLTAGLHWLTCAAAETTTITVDTLRAVQDDAMQRYRDGLLQAFTWHHWVLLEVIDQATAGMATVTSGSVYDRYTERCKDTKTDPLTARRISDYLTHLELLELIDVTHHRGGPQGKTREIRPTPLQEL